MDQPLEASVAPTASDIRCMEGPLPFDKSPLRGSSDADGECGQGGPWVHARGVCATVSGVSGGARHSPLARGARERSQRRPAARFPPMARFGQGGHERHVAGRKARRAGRPGRAPLELARDDVARDPHLAPRSGRCRGGRTMSSPTAAGARRARPCSRSRAQTEIGPPRPSRAATRDAVSASGTTTTASVRPRGVGEARVVGRRRLEDRRRRRRRQARRPDVGVLGARIADAAAAPRPPSAPRRGPAPRPRP